MKEVGLSGWGFERIFGMEFEESFSFRFKFVFNYCFCRLYCFLSLVCFLVEWGNNVFFVEVC